MSNQNEKIVFSTNVNASLFRSLRAYRNLWITQYTERKRLAIKEITAHVLKKRKLETLAKQFSPLTF